MPKITKKIILVVFIQILLFSTGCISITTHNTKKRLDRVKIKSVKERLKENTKEAKAFNCMGDDNTFYIKGLLKKNKVISASQNSNISYIKKNPKCTVANEYKVIVNPEPKEKVEYGYSLYESDDKKQSFTYLEVIKENSFKKHSIAGQKILELKEQENIDIYLINDFIYIDSDDYKEKLLKLLPEAENFIVTDEIERIREVGTFKSKNHENGDTCYYFRDGLPTRTFSKDSSIGKFLLEISKTKYKTYLYKKDVYFQTTLKNYSYKNEYKSSALTFDGEIKKNVKRLPIGAEEMGTSSINVEDKEIQLKVTDYRDRELTNPHQDIIKFLDDIPAGKRTAHLKYDSSLKDYAVYLAPKNKDSKDKVVVITDSDNYHFVNKLPINSFKPLNQHLQRIEENMDTIKLILYNPKTISSEHLEVDDYKFFYFNQLFLIGTFPIALFAETTLVFITYPIIYPLAFIESSYHNLDTQETFEMYYKIE